MPFNRQCFSSDFSFLVVKTYLQYRTGFYGCHILQVVINLEALFFLPNCVTLFAVKWVRNTDGMRVFHFGRETSEILFSVVKPSLQYKTDCHFCKL